MIQRHLQMFQAIVIVAGLNAASMTAAAQTGGHNPDAQHSDQVAPSSYRATFLDWLNGISPSLSDAARWKRSQGVGLEIPVTPDSREDLLRSGARVGQSGDDLFVQPDLSVAEFEISVPWRDSRITAGRALLAGDYLILDDLVIENTRGRIEASRLAAPGSVLKPLLRGMFNEGRSVIADGRLEIRNLSVSTPVFTRGERRFESRLEVASLVIFDLDLSSAGKRGGFPLFREMIAAEINARAHFSASASASIGKLSASLKGAPQPWNAFSVLTREPDLHGREALLDIDVGRFNFAVWPSDADRVSADTFRLEDGGLRISRDRLGGLRLTGTAQGVASTAFLGELTGKKVDFSTNLDMACSKGRLALREFGISVSGLAAAQAGMELNLPSCRPQDLKTAGRGLITTATAEELELDVEDRGAVELAESLTGIESSLQVKNAARRFFSGSMEQMAFGFALNELAKILDRLETDGRVRLSASFKEPEPLLTAVTLFLASAGSKPKDSQHPGGR